MPRVTISVRPSPFSVVRAFALCVLCLLCVLCDGLAQEKPQSKAPADLPPYGALKAVPAPTVRQEKLPNGLVVWLVPRPGFPKVAYTLAVRGGGYAGDPQDRPGLSEFLAQTIDQGTRTRTAKQIAEQFQAAGGDLSGEPSTDYLPLTISVLADKAEGALAVLSDVTQNATFPEAEVEIARSNLQQSLALRESDPAFLARRAIARAMFGTHPYSISAPTQASIQQTTVADLRREYTRRLRPDQSLLVAVGDFDATRMLAEITRDFGAWKPPAEPAVTVPAAPQQGGSHTLYLVPRAGSVQTEMTLAAFGPTEAQPDYIAARVANAIYGGMFGSRLIKNIREDKGYTYSPGARLASYRATGMLATSAAVRNAVTGASWNEIQYELNRMATTSPSTDEVQRAQRYLVGNIALSLQAEAAVAQRLAALWINGLPPEELGAQTQKIEKVTAADIDGIARKYFPASRMTIVAVGDEKTVREQMAPFGIEIKPVP